MIALYKALLAHYNDSPLAAMTTGLYLYRAPQDATGNYITMRMISGKADYSFSDVMEDCVVQFSVWTDERSPIAALGIADWLNLWFNELSIPIAGTMVRAMRLTSPLLLPDPDVEWQVAVDYSFWVQEA